MDKVTYFCFIPRDYLMIQNGLLHSGKVGDENIAATTAKKEKINYPFVNLIRFISMMGIVWSHIELRYSDGSIPLYLSKASTNTLISYSQLGKFATICFFMISGFLLGDKIDAVNPIVYYKRRLATTLKPYLIPFLIFFVLIFTKFYFLHKHIEGVNSLTDVLLYSLFSTPLWFLPTYLLSLGIILCFSKLVYSKYLGAFFLFLTLVYTFLTVYNKQHLMSHNLAILGWVFYLWLGTYIRKKGWADKIKKADTKLVVGLTIAVYVISCLEAFYLNNHGYSSYNTLRLGNQLYSVAIFILLINTCPQAPKFGIFNPRQETYGIYLYHTIITYFLPKIIETVEAKLNINIYSYNVFVIITAHLFAFVLVYLITTFFVKFLLKYNLVFLKFS